MDTENMVSEGERSQHQSQHGSSSEKNRKKEDYKAVSFKLGILEIILGVICFVIECVLLGIITKNPVVKYKVIRPDYNSTRRVYRQTIGSGIWCGVWIILGGVFSLLAGRAQTAKKQTILAYLSMAFNIVGTLFAFILSITAAIYSGISGIRDYDSYKITVGMTSSFGLMAFVAFTACVLHLISASVSCPLVGCCDQGKCCCCGQEDDYYGGKIYYQPQPVQYQPAAPAGYVYAAPSSGQPTLQYSNSVLQYPVQQSHYPAQFQQQTVQAQMNPVVAQSSPGQFQ